MSTAPAARRVCCEVFEAAVKQGAVQLTGRTVLGNLADNVCSSGLKYVLSWSRQQLILAMAAYGDNKKVFSVSKVLLEVQVVFNVSQIIVYCILIGMQAQQKQV